MYWSENFVASLHGENIPKKFARFLGSFWHQNCHIAMLRKKSYEADKIFKLIFEKPITFLVSQGWWQSWCQIDPWNLAYFSGKVWCPKFNKKISCQ